MTNQKRIDIPVKVSSIDEENATLLATFSTPDVDRHGESVKQDWDVDSFLNNPVVLNSHTHDDAGEVIGRVEWMTSNPEKLEGKIKFATEENPKAKVIYDLYKGGFLNAFSVGFIPGEEKNELLEVSAVSVPANAMALAKQKGIDVEELEEDEEEIGEESPAEDAENSEGEVKEEELDTDEIEEIKIDGKSFINEEQIETEILKAMFVKEGRVLSKTNREKVENAIDALNKLLEADNRDKTNDLELEEIKPQKDIKSVIKKLHQEVAETHEDNLKIKKRNLHQALRKLSGDR